MTLSFSDFFLHGYKILFQYEPMHERITFHVTGYNNTLLASFVIRYSKRNAAHTIFGYMESETFKAVRLLSSSKKAL